MRYLLAPLVAPILSALLVTPAAAQAPGGTLVIAVAGEPGSPVPTLWQNDQGNRELSDLMFLRLADLGPALNTLDEKTFVPRLARRWERRDPLTLVFELDRRARWEDGQPVTAQDVVFTLDRARNPKLSPQTATLLSRLRGVSADGDYRVVAQFTEAYPEQFYDVTYHAPPLPAHLVSAIPPESLATSAFVAHPVGNGPYRFVRRTPGQFVELAANEQFFLGRPGIRKVIIQFVRDPETRVNLLLSGSVDAIDNIYSLPNWARVERLPDYQYYPVPGPLLVYALLNQRDPADTTRPHPILGDSVVRRVLTESLDRERVVRTVYGPLAQVPDAPVSALLNRSVEAPRPVPFDTAAARRALLADGWADHDGDGILDRDGKPLSLRLMIPNTSSARIAMGTQMQEMWRRVGIAVDIEQVDRPIYVERTAAGRFDLALHASIQDPTPSGLVQSWSCAGVGGSNLAHYCDPVVDSLLRRAAIGDAGRAARLYRDTVRRIADDFPAIFLATAVSGTPVHRRFTNVVVRPESSWSLIWQWTLKPGQQIDRDRQ